MAQHLVELCAILVEESFGDTAALIWSHLAEHGRTQFAELTSIASVTASQLAHVLPILVLNRAVVYYIDPDYDATWYSVNLEGTYNILRYSRLGDIVRERCGKDASDVLTNMSQLGHITVGELAVEYGLTPATKPNARKGQHTNGTIHRSGSAPRDVTSIETVEQLHAALTQLIRAGFLVKANPHYFQTDFDLQQALEKHVQEEHFPGGKITGPKASREFSAAVDSQKRKQRDADLVMDGIPAVRDDRHSGSNPYKRQKTNGHVTNGSHARSLPDDLILTVNMNKYLLALRSKTFVGTAADYLGQASGHIYSSFLQTIEKQLHDVSDGQRTIRYDDSDDEGIADTKGPRATASDVYDAIDPDLDLTTSIKVSAKDLPNGVAHGKAAKSRQIKEDFSAIGIKQEQDSDDDDGAAELSGFQNRAKLMDMIERHLHSLAEHSSGFCKRDGHGRPTVWSVDFEALTETFVLAEIDASVMARFGKSATRLVRMLREKGKLEEKQISAYAFMHMKDVRAILSELYAAGYVEAQELAKDQTRQPAKALYLWYFDAPKVQRMIVHQCYQSISRLYQRMAAERERFRTVITKVHRLAEARFFGDHYFNNKKSADDDGEEEAREDEDDQKDDQKDDQEDDVEQDEPVRFVLGPTNFWKNDAMNNIEKQQITEWRGVESNFLGQIMRLDDVIVLLRDFSGQYNMASA